MATDTLITSLPEQERSALALCGITQDSQLAAITPDKLLRDLEQAAVFFPEQLRTLPPAARLQELCRQAAEQAAGSTPQAGGNHEEEEEDSVLPRFLGRNVPTFEPARGSRRGGRGKGNGQAIDLADAQPAGPKDDPRGFTHSICCARPIATYFGAWATLALVAAFFAILYILFQLLIGVRLTGAHIRYAQVLLAVVVVYYLFLRSATCSTCRIGIFSFRRYPRHRQAHHSILLGYTIPTALSIIFCLRYRCPSCGTPQKLYGRSHRRYRG